MGKEKRDYYFDNAKFILIFLVVFGHFISPHKSNSDVLYTVYNFIYTFHMPAFILIAGFFSKSIFKEGYLKNIFKKILIPYFIFQIIYFAFYTIKNGSETFKLFDPYWTLWFLLSLVLWNVLLVIFARIKYPLIVALGLGLIAGYVQDIGTFLSLSRTFVFFPVFLLGYYLKKEHFYALLNTRKRIAASTLFVTMFISYYFFFPEAAKEWLLASSSYEELGVGVEQAILIRLLMYGLMLIATFSFMALVPRRKLFFTHMGGRTLYVYLLHGFIVKLFSITPFYDAIQDTGNYILFVVLAAVVTLSLASKPIMTLAQPLIELRTSLLQKSMYRKRNTADAS
ncbi:acyltransferase family protein [Pseudalkalibacillus berkeleyi]|uniref:Acyltransferase family protein n=1 Tax=Pseudalkalibacillus berkeleyi TaxID=1069813 RepID=A0ABS9GUC4_9BACL|nr:acyltransferase family protein [Pseudalkalibacillus berkeleyi]MCF6136284.1 acyltransferase family protein [Pseudalkalibacillus berkeleyi]